MSVLPRLLFKAARSVSPTRRVEYTNRCQHMRGVCPLAATRFEQPLRPCHREQGLVEAASPATSRGGTRSGRYGGSQDQ